MRKLLSALTFCAIGWAAPANAQVICKEPVSIILDADIGSSTDDLLAMDMLYKYMDEGRANLLAIMVDRPGKVNAEITDVFNTFYGYPDIPIGITSKGADAEVFIDYSVVTKKDENFQRTIKDADKLPESLELYRKILSAQPDNSVVIIATGFVTNLARLMESKGDKYSPLSGMELIKRKVKAMYLQAGAFYATDESDYNIPSDKAAGKIVCENWPTNIYLSPMEVGAMVDYPAKHILADLADFEKHPLKTIYSKCFTDTGQRMWDVNAVIQCIEGNDFYTLSMPCKLKINDEGFVEYRLAKDGNAYYQITNRQQAYAIYALLREKTSQAPKCLKK